MAQLGYDITYILTGVKLVPQIAGLDAAANIWDIDGNNEAGAISKEQERWLGILESLAGGDQERLKLIGLALVGYSQARTDK